VFNPAGERVEGYTNFLWVLVLAAGQALRIAPEAAAPVLTIGTTVALFGLILAFLLRDPAARERPHLLLMPAGAPGRDAQLRGVVDERARDPAVRAARRGGGVPSPGGARVRGPDAVTADRRGASGTGNPHPA
jgi:hypothetical protein